MEEIVTIKNIINAFKHKSFLLRSIRTLKIQRHLSSFENVLEFIDIY